MKARRDRSIAAARRGTARAAPVIAVSALLSGCATSPGGTPGAAVVPWGLTVSTDSRFYSVSGLTARQLAVEMEHRGPDTEDGRPAYASTEWTIQWRLRFSERRGRCEISDVGVAVIAVTLLPRWLPPPRSSRELKAAWELFIAALAAHEEGHSELAIQGASRVFQRLRSVTAATCDALPTLANSAARTIVSEVEERQHAYDVDTENGRDQGVVWPPDAFTTGR